MLLVNVIQHCCTERDDKCISKMHSCIPAILMAYIVGEVHFLAHHGGCWVSSAKCEKTHERLTDHFSNFHANSLSVVRKFLNEKNTQKTTVLRDGKLCQCRNVNQQWSGILIWLSRLILIPIQVSVGLLPKCCGFIALSVSVISPSFVKIVQWLFEKC